MVAPTTSVGSSSVKHHKIKHSHKPDGKSTHHHTTKKVSTSISTPVSTSVISPELQRVLKATDKLDPEKAPKPAMSHKIAGHFLSGPFIEDLSVDSQALEGSPWATMAAYFLHTLKEVEHAEKLTGDAEMAFLRKSLRQMLRIQAVIKKIHSIYPEPKQWEKRAQLFAQWMIHKMTQMKPDEQWMIPGGWLGKRSPGHAMIYHFIKQRDGRYTMRIYNTGAGIEHHLRYGSKVLPLSKKDLSLKSLQRPEVWQAYYEMTHEYVRDPKSPTKPLHDAETIAQQTYQWLESIHEHFAHEGAKESLSSPLQPTDFHSKQKTNTCAFESLWMLGKQTKSFLRIKEKIRKKILCDYEAYLVKEGHLPARAHGNGAPPVARVPVTYQGVIKTQGMIDFFHECVKRFAKEPLKEIRKRPDTISLKRRQERTALLKDFEERIKVQREACNAKLSSLLALKPLKLDNSTLSLPAPKELADAPSGGIVTSASYPFKCPPIQWPAKEHLEDWVIYCSGFRSNVSPAVAYSYLSTVFSQIPPVDDPYWDTIGTYSASSIKALSDLVALFRKISLKNPDHPFEADLHYFHMEKILAIFLKLAKADPILDRSNGVLDLSWLPAKDSSEHYPMLFVSDPQTDRQIASTHAFLNTYAPPFSRLLCNEIAQQTSAKFSKHLLVEDKINNGDAFFFSNEGEAVWKYLQADNGLKKKEIEERIGKECPQLVGKALPNSLILAYAMLHRTREKDPQDLPTPAYHYIKEHMFSMIQQLYAKKNSNLQTTLFPRLDDYADDPRQETFSVRTVMGARGDLWHERWADALGIEDALFSKKEQAVLGFQNEETRGLYSLCSGSRPMDRPLRAIEFFTKYNRLLDDPQNQAILYSCLFHPGLLRAQLKSNPEFARILVQFVTRNYENARKDRVETAFFLLRLSSQLELYCHDSLAGQPILEEIAFPSLWDELAGLQHQIEKDEGISSERRIQLQSLIAREALAFLGRGDAACKQLAAKPTILKDLLQYQFFLTDHPLPATSKNPILDAQVTKGVVALIGFFQQVEKEPSLSQVISQSLTEAVGFNPTDKKKIVWDTSTLPFIKGSVIRRGKKKAEKEYAIHLHTGTLFVDRRRTSTQPPQWIASAFSQSSYERYISKAQSTQFQEEGGPPRLCYFTSEGTEFYVVEKDAGKEYPLFIKYEGRWCQYYPDLPNSVRSATKHSDPWLDKNTIRFLSRKTGSLTHVYDFHKQRLTCVEDHLKAADMRQPTYRQFTNFDSDAQVWKTTEGVIKRIDFPTHQLIFNADETGQLLGTGDFAGMRIAEQQLIKTLSGVTGTLVLEHLVTKERRVLLPPYYPKEKTDFTKPPKLSHDLGKESTYSMFNIVGHRDLLEPTRQKTRIQEYLHLVLIYLAQHKYAQAYHILEQETVSSTPYTLEEWKMLFTILLNKNNFQAMQAPEAIAIRLKTAALVTINQRQGTIKEMEDTSSMESYTQMLLSWSNYKNKDLTEEDQSLRKEWNLYSQQKGRLPDFMLITAQEEQALLEVLGTSADSSSYKQSRVAGGWFPEEYSAKNRKDECLSANSVIWEKCRAKGQAFSLTILDTTVFSSNLGPKEMGKAFLSFYAICCDPSTDAASLERKARLNALLENLYIASDPGVAECSKLLQMILQGKVAKDKVLSVKAMQKLVNEAKSNKHQQNKLEAFCELAKSYKPRAGFSYRLPFQKPPEEQRASTLPTGYEPIPQQTLADALPVIDETTQARSFTQIPREIILPREFLNEDLATDKVEQNAFRALQESAEGYAMGLQESREWAIENPKLLELETFLTENVEKHRMELRQKQRALRNLANSYPALSPLAIEHTLKQQAALKEKIDWRHLQLLYVQGNALAYKELNPLLDEVMVQKIHHDTEQLLLNATEQQQRVRALNLIQAIKESKSSQERSELVQKLHHEISSKRAYCPTKHPEILVYEYRRDLQLRESQVQQIETLMDQGLDRVLEIIMGSGKSDILLPLLALKLADGKKLSMLVLPEDLIATIAPMMHIRARGIFRQIANRLDWEGDVHVLYKNLEKIIQGREFLLVTANDLHQFALAARKAREDYLIAKNPQAEEKLAGYKKVLRLLKTRGHAIVDEVDSQLRTDLQVLRALGIPRRVPKEYCDATTLLYDLLAKDKTIQSKVYFEFSKTHKETAQPYVEKLHKAFLIKQLAKRFLKSPKLKQLRLSYTKKDYKAVLTYLIEPPEKGILLPARFDQRTKDTLAIVRNQLHVIFPITLGKNYGENYGVAPIKKNGNSNPSAIPYGGALKPRPQSQFASYQEQISYTLQSYRKGGVPADLLKSHVEKMQSQMTAEISRTSIAPEQTRAYSQYVLLVGKTLAKEYPLETIKTEQFQELAAKLSKKPSLIHRFVNCCILPTIKSYPCYISSNGKNLVDMLHRVHGVSGTVERDKDSLSSRFTVTTDPTIRGKTLICCEKIEKPLLLKNTPKPLELLKEVLKKAAAHKETQDNIVRALIDRGALFKDIPAIEIAKTILEWGKTQVPPIQSVIYFDKNKKLALLQGQSEPQFYHADLDKDPSTRFTYYPQPQTIGADVPQAFNAASVMTLNKNTDFQQTEQGGWRMRGLEKGQCLLFAVPEDAVMLIADKAKKAPEELTSSDLLSYTLQREVRTQMSNNQKAIYQMLDNAFLSQCESIFDAVEIEEWQHPAYEELHRFTTVKMEDQPYQQFGQGVTVKEAGQVLHEHRRVLMDKLRDWYVTHGDIVKGHLGAQWPDDIAALDAQMRQIIERAIDPERPIVPEKLSTKQNIAQETEIELEQETEQEVEAEEENEQENQRENNLSVRQFDDWSAPRSWKKPQKKLKKDPFAGMFDKHKRFEINPALLFEKDYFTPHPFTEPLPDSKDHCFLTVADTLLLDEEGVSPFQKKANTFFDPNLLTSFNAASASGKNRLFRGNQRPLGSTLLIQDAQNPKDVRLVLLSFDEEKELLKYLRQDQQNPISPVSERRHRLALFSPQMHASYGNGIYAEGAAPIDRDALFAKDPEDPLNAFERLVVQSKMAMGETRAYSPREQFYISQWLQKHELPSEEFGKVFERIFLPGLVQTYANSTLEFLFKGAAPESRTRPLQRKKIPVSKHLQRHQASPRREGKREVFEGKREVIARRIPGELEKIVIGLE